MEKENVIKSLLEGKRFYNPNINSNLNFKVTKWNGNPESPAKVMCTKGLCSWSETWGDMNITVMAFSFGEYKFM